MPSHLGVATGIAPEGTTMTQSDDLETPETLLTPSEVAALFRVNPKTVTRWARAGKLNAIRTLGGHRRFRASEIRRCLEEMSHEPGLVDEG
jgi:excisionase family DNA binding protein